MPTALPYFFSDSLRSRFAQDIQDAIGSSRISSDDGKWLQRLLAASIEPGTDAGLPRVDRLIMGDNSPDDAELAGAWLISDPVASATSVFFEYAGFRNRALRKPLLAAHRLTGAVQQRQRYLYCRGRACRRLTVRCAHAGCHAPAGRASAKPVYSVAGVAGSARCGRQGVAERFSAERPCRGYRRLQSDRAASGYQP